MTTWRDNAKCLGQPTAWFDYENLPTGAARKDAAARTLCRGCPVISDCRLDALENWDITRGHVVGGIPVPSTNTGRNAAHHRLAIEANVAIPEPAKGRPRGQRLTANCAECSRAMRGGRERLADRPGTVLFAGRGLCSTCYKSGKRAAA